MAEGISSHMDIFAFCNDEQIFVGNAREDGSGRIRSRAKIEATASDGTENASDHFVASFLVIGGIEKAELQKKLRHHSEEDTN